MVDHIPQPTHKPTSVMPDSKSYGKPNQYPRENYLSYLLCIFRMFISFSYFANWESYEVSRGMLPLLMTLWYCGGGSKPFPSEPATWGQMKGQKTCIIPKSSEIYANMQIKYSIWIKCWNTLCHFIFYLRMQNITV